MVAEDRAPRVLRPRQMLGKYRLDRRIASGGFAAVWRAFDTIEGLNVALKIPHQHLMTKAALEDMQKEVRLGARLHHANILQVKNASMIDGLFVIAYPLAKESLDDRMKKRIAGRTALHFAEQILSAVAYAHEHRIIHLDIKPENILLFGENELRLGDFGIAKIALRTRTLYGSGAGTIGYIAPEQALGRPSFRSDVFAVGLIMVRMLSGELPDWPYEWPPPGYERLRRRVHPELVSFLRRAIQVDQRKRFRDAGHMFASFQRIRGHALGRLARKRRTGRQREASWKTIRHKEFKRRFGSSLGVRAQCSRCAGPMAEPMLGCPWCGRDHTVYRGETAFPRRCPRCRRGMKADWRFCAWCYGPGFEPETSRTFGDARYTARCPNPRCDRRELMPFMRYCPWCRTKVRRRWKVPDPSSACARCGWGVLREYWSFCPWCGERQGTE